MNKLVKFVVCVSMSIGMGIAAYASIPAYQVYDIKFNARTTAAKGVTTLGDSCCGAGDEYVYREKSSVVIKGVLAGCGCGAILANGSCENAILWLWDDTRKLAITNVETQTGWRIQVIGKDQKKVENFMRFTAIYGDNNEYALDVTMCGFGAHKIDTKDHNYDYATGISGYFAGWITAPSYYKAGTCGVCGVGEPTIFSMSQALAMCGCSEYEGTADSDFTPFGGTYTVNYNRSKSNNVTKKGMSEKTFGLPSYVGFNDCVGTNIGE